MYKRWIMIVCGAVLAVSLTACSMVKKPEKQTEALTTESETEIQSTEEETMEEETKEKETKVVTKPQTEPQKPQTEVFIPQADKSVQSETSVQTISEVPQTMSEVPSSPEYEEEYMQCPYCAEWFYAQPDGGLWTPYDRHVLSERDRIEGGYQTEQPKEQAMAQCPNCLNWYETGNIFRNHICSGRGQEIQE